MYGHKHYCHHSWSNISIRNEQYLFLPEEINKIPEDYRTTMAGRYSDYNDDSFGFFAAISLSGKTTSKTDYKSFKNFFNKCKNVLLTFESLKLINMNIIGCISRLENGRHIIDKVDLFSEDELLNFIEENKNKYFYFLLSRDFKRSELDYIKLSCNDTRAKYCLIKTNKGYIKDFINLSPEYTENKEEALKLKNTQGMREGLLYLYNIDKEIRNIIIE